MIEYLIEEHLKDFKATNILDVGPGYGSFSRLAARVTGASDVTFLDCNTSVLTWQEEECNKHALSSKGILTTLSKDELLNLDGIYDLILCQEVLEHLSNAEEILNILSQKLSDNGRMVITVPTKCSERWLEMINPDYMCNDLYGHVRKFDEQLLRKIIKDAELFTLVFIPAQPHYFIYHTWVFGSRMKVDGSTGEIVSNDFRNYFSKILMSITKKFFRTTGIERWGKILPRNYFVIATRSTL